MSEQGSGGRIGFEDAEAGQLGRDFAQLFDEVIEVALGGLFTAVAERGLGFAELLVLRALANGSPASGLSRRPLSRADLARATGLSDTAVTDVVLGLEGQELTTSTREDTVSLTTDGQALLRDLRSRRLDNLTAFVRDQDLGKRLRLAGALHLLDTDFDDRVPAEQSDESGTGHAWIDR